MRNTLGTKIKMFAMVGNQLLIGLVLATFYAQWAKNISRYSSLKERSRRPR